MDPIVIEKSSMKDIYKFNTSSNSIKKYNYIYIYYISKKERAFLFKQQKKRYATATR